MAGMEFEGMKIVGENGKCMPYFNETKADYNWNFVTSNGATNESNNYENSYGHYISQNGEIAYISRGNCKIV